MVPEFEIGALGFRVQGCVQDVRIEVAPMGSPTARTSLRIRISGSHLVAEA